MQPCSSFMIHTSNQKFCIQIRFGGTTKNHCSEHKPAFIKVKPHSSFKFSCSFLFTVITDCVDFAVGSRVEAEEDYVLFCQNKADMF